MYGSGGTGGAGGADWTNLWTNAAAGGYTTTSSAQAPAAGANLLQQFIAQNQQKQATANANINQYFTSQAASEYESTSSRQLPEHQQNRMAFNTNASTQQNLGRAQGGMAINNSGQAPFTNFKIAQPEPEPAAYDSLSMKRPNKLQNTATGSGLMGSIAYSSQRNTRDQMQNKTFQQSYGVQAQNQGSVSRNQAKNDDYATTGLNWQARISQAAPPPPPPPPPPPKEKPNVNPPLPLFRDDARQHAQMPSSQFRGTQQQQQSTQSAPRFRSNQNQQQPKALASQSQLFRSRQNQQQQQSNAFSSQVFGANQNQQISPALTSPLFGANQNQQISPALPSPLFGVMQNQEQSKALSSQLFRGNPNQQRASSPSAFYRGNQNQQQQPAASHFTGNQNQQRQPTPLLQQRMPSVRDQQFMPSTFQQVRGQQQQQRPFLMQPVTDQRQSDPPFHDENQSQKQDSSGYWERASDMEPGGIVTTNLPALMDIIVNKAPKDPAVIPGLGDLPPVDQPAKSDNRTLETVSSNSTLAATSAKSLQEPQVQEAQIQPSANSDVSCTSNKDGTQSHLALAETSHIQELQPQLTPGNKPQLINNNNVKPAPKSTISDMSFGSSASGKDGFDDGKGEDRTNSALIDQKTLRAFDEKFRNWEKQFEDWKSLNRNHPDRHAYDKYMDQWNDMRQQLVEQRRSIITNIEKTRLANFALDSDLNLVSTENDEVVREELRDQKLEEKNIKEEVIILERKENAVTVIEAKKDSSPSPSLPSLEVELVETAEKDREIPKDPEIEKMKLFLKSGTVGDPTNQKIEKARNLLANPMATRGMHQGTEHGDTELAQHGLPNRQSTQTGGNMFPSSANSTNYGYNPNQMSMPNMPQRLYGGRSRFLLHQTLHPSHLEFGRLNRNMNPNQFSKDDTEWETYQEYEEETPIGRSGSDYTIRAMEKPALSEDLYTRRRAPAASEVRSEVEDEDDNTTVVIDYAHGDTDPIIETLYTRERRPGASEENQYEEEYSEFPDDGESLGPVIDYGHGTAPPTVYGTQEDENERFHARFEEDYYEEPEEYEEPDPADYEYAYANPPPPARRGVRGPFMGRGRGPFPFPYMMGPRGFPPMGFSFPMGPRFGPPMGPRLFHPMVGYDYPYELPRRPRPQQPEIIPPTSREERPPDGPAESFVRGIRVAPPLEAKDVPEATPVRSPALSPTIAAPIRSAPPLSPTSEFRRAPTRSLKTDDLDWISPEGSPEPSYTIESRSRQRDEKSREMDERNRDRDSRNRTQTRSNDRRTSYKDESPRRSNRREESPKRSSRREESPKRIARREESPRRSNRREESPRRSSRREESPRRRDYDRDTRRERRSRSRSPLGGSRNNYSVAKPSNSSSSSMFLSQPTSRSTDSFSSSSPRYQTVLIEDILNLPGRKKRPHSILIILRGLPGSGKTHVAKLIKDREIELGVSAPRILSLDDYFMTGESEKIVKDPNTGKDVKDKQMVYEYEKELEPKYREDLFKTFKKTIESGFFRFIILDCVNDKIKHFDDFANYAALRKFQVYVAELEERVEECFKRNVHHRTKEEIQNLAKFWEKHSYSLVKLDVRTLLQDEAIQDVEMEDVSDTENFSEEPPSLLKKSDEIVCVDLEEEDEPEPAWVKSKWESSEEKMNKLDGLVKKKKSGEDEDEAPQSMEAWLQSHLPEDYNVRKDTTPGKKRVRWADIEERREQERARQIGFVVGQDWNRMTDPTFGESALTRTKFI